MRSDFNGPELSRELPVLVTGAAGFIGSRVVEFLLEDGYRVIGLDNLNDGYDVRLKEWPPPVRGLGRFRISEGRRLPLESAL